MNEDLSLPSRSRGLLRPIPATAQWRERRRLRQRDRLSAELAKLHGTVSALAAAQTAVDIGWARSSNCATCNVGSRADTALGCCLVCALTLGSGTSRRQLNSSTQAAIDLVWRSMHRTGHRPVHWNATSVMQGLQAHELTRWNDRADVTGAAVSTLLRKARAAADTALQTARTASTRPVPATPAPGELTH